LQLCRYVERQWLNKSSIGAARMSVRGNPARTNNAVESFHSALRRRVKVAHPNLYGGAEIAGLDNDGRTCEQLTELKLHNFIT